jgi:hypothetical protein
LPKKKTWKNLELQFDKFKFLDYVLCHMDLLVNKKVNKKGFMDWVWTSCVVFYSSVGLISTILEHQTAILLPMSYIVVISVAGLRVWVNRFYLSYIAQAT